MSVFNCNKFVAVCAKYSQDIDLMSPTAISYLSFEGGISTHLVRKWG